MDSLVTLKNRQHLTRLSFILNYRIVVFRNSSAVEQLAVNQLVLGSNPSFGAIRLDFKMSEKTKKNTIVGFILGLIAIIAWLIPLFGFPVTIVGLVFSIKELNGEKRNLAITGLVLNIIFLVLTLINSALGVYLALTSVQ